MITVFTPTYNRAYILKKLYKSLCEQIDKDFEWLIVDDGSTDNTEDLILLWINERKLDIRFFKQENGGKHRAINRGAKEAKGELFYIVDSDDQLPNDSLQLVNYYFQEIKADPSYAGVCGLKAFFDGQRVGGKLDFDILDCNSLDFRFKYHVKGDLAEVVKTEVLRHYPFPDYIGEKFCAESLVWNRIACNYKMRYFNKNIYLCDYLPDGLSFSSIRNRRNSPTYATQIYRELLNMDVPLMIKIKSIINYWRFAPMLKRKTTNRLPLYAFLFVPFGYFLCLKDSLKTKDK